MIYPKLLQKVEEQISVFYRDHNDTNFCYHNQSLTAEVLETTGRIAEHYKLDERDHFIVCTAASFLYTGFSIAKSENCEAKSAEIAATFLSLKGVELAIVDAIKTCILSTQFPQSPTTLTEKILCDADSYFLGTNSFNAKLKLLKKEKEAIIGEKIDGNTWRTANIKMMATHHYYTDYCQLLLDQTKAENLALIQNRHE